MREFVMHVGEFDNAYALHQKVWAGVKKLVGDGIHFVFREAGGYVKVRHGAGEVGRPCLVPETGKRYRFDVLVNPVRSVPGKKIAVSLPEEAVTIVTRHLEKNGFSVLSADGDFVRGSMLGKPGLKDFRIRSFLAYGEVLVVDGEKAAAVMQKGIGAAKRFGYGMIDLEEIK
jgi:hypothetical protein